MIARLREIIDRRRLHRIKTKIASLNGNGLRGGWRGRIDTIRMVRLAKRRSALLPRIAEWDTRGHERNSKWQQKKDAGKSLTKIALIGGAGFALSQGLAASNPPRPPETIVKYVPHDVVRYVDVPGICPAASPSQASRNFKVPTAPVPQVTPTMPFKCNDGTTQYRATKVGACSSHGGMRDDDPPLKISSTPPVAAITHEKPSSGGISCSDGSTSSSSTRRGACSHHGGIRHHSRRRR